MPSTRTPRSWSPSDLKGARIALYGRASDDHRDTKTSVTAQLAFGEKWALSQGCIISGRFCDNDLSASHYATKEREDFLRLLREVEAGQHDLIWFWTLSRNTRRLDVYVQLRDLCRARGIGWVIKKRLYDLNDAADLRTLGNDAVNAEVDSIEKSENVRLGIELAAAQGKPHGKVPYGYKRVYDDRGRYAGQVPNETLQRAVSPDGAEYWFSTAGIVREIIRRIAAGHPIIAIKRSLEARGIPTPRGAARWSRASVRQIATNRSYVGTRTFHGEAVDRPGPCWEPIMAGEDEEVFYAAQNILTAPDRLQTRPGRAKHLLSHVARCGDCGGGLGARDSNGRLSYRCEDNHVFIYADELDQFVRDVIDAYLAREDVAEFLAAGHAADPAVMVARAEAERLRGEIETYRQLAENGAIDAVDYARITAGLKAKLALAEERAVDLAVPPVLRELPIPWDNIPVARQAVAAVAEIKVLPVNGERNVPLDENRVGWRWLLGPDAA